MKIKGIKFKNRYFVFIVFFIFLNIINIVLNLYQIHINGDLIDPIKIIINDNKGNLQVNNISIIGTTLSNRKEKYTFHNNFWISEDNYFKEITIKIKNPIATSILINIGKSNYKLNFMKSSEINITKKDLTTRDSDKGLPIINFVDIQSMKKIFKERFLEINSITKELLKISLIFIIIIFGWFLFEFSNYKTNNKTRIIYIYPILVILVFIIILVIFNFKLFLYESNDEVAHTFVEIPNYFKYLKNNQIQTVNLFNNFGTPLLGDPVFNPLAPQSLTYLIFPDYFAATINRLLIIYLTLVVLGFFYYYCFSLSPPAAVISSLLVVLHPNFQWFSVNHPHQSVVLNFALVLLCRFLYLQKRNKLWFILSYLAVILFFSAIGINGLILGVCFLGIYFFIEYLNNKDKNIFLYSGSLILAGFFISWPKIFYFLTWAKISARKSLDYSKIIPYTPPRLLIDIILFTIQKKIIHVSDCVFYSFPIVFLAFISLRKIFNKEYLVKILFLGFFPFVGVIFLLMFPELRNNIPIIKSIDITRVMWFANIFIFSAIGIYYDWLSRKNINIKKTIDHNILFFLFIIAYLFLFFYHINNVCIVLNVILFFLFVIFKRKLLGNAKILLIIIIVLSMVHVINNTLIYGYYLRDKQYSVLPEKISKYIEPFSRIASNFDPVKKAYIQKFGLKNVFCSDGRSIILNNNFKEVLTEDKLITQGWYDMTYYFTSTDAEKLSRYGIKYMLVSKENKRKYQKAGWIYIDRYDNPNDLNDVVYIFKNPVEPSIIYFIDDNNKVFFVKNFQIFANEIVINPITINKKGKLIVAFINWPCWKAYINGKEVKLLDNREKFLKIKVDNSAKNISFKFENNYLIKQSFALLLFIILVYFMYIYNFSISAKGRNK